ncbi:hypothetical protein [Microbacterium sp. CJ88]|uniref:hypothetical protein n=1 Tax=Microbacterium sp. CJ88 TaxID=3445672 RepID=UPI003F65D9CC
MRRGRAAAALVLATAVSISVTGCGFSIPPLSGTTSDHTTQGTPVSDTDSTLDPAGIQQILDSGTARFDLTGGALRKADVGLAVDAIVPDISSPRPLELTITGSGGQLRARTDRLRFLSTATTAEIPTIYYFLTAADPDALFALLRDGVGSYGFDPESVEAWIAAQQADPQGTSSYALQPGEALGFRVTYDVRYDGGASAQVVIVSVTA